MNRIDSGDIKILVRFPENSVLKFSPNFETAWDAPISVGGFKFKFSNLLALVLGACINKNRNVPRNSYFAIVIYDLLDFGQTHAISTEIL